MEKKWTTVIEPKGRFFDLKLKEVWKYRGLIGLFVKRNFKTRYKQTILGPLWFVIQPIFSTVIHTIIFGSIANLNSSGVPDFLFYMAGNLPWMFFASCLTGAAGTFSGNAGLFGKVYFPRMVAPITMVLTNLGNIAIQLGLMILVQGYYMITGANVCPTWELVYLPLIFFQMALLGVGIGLIVSSLTTKYRDLSLFIGFGVSALMYLTPVAYDMATLFPDGPSTLYTIMMINPMSSIVEMFRYMTLGSGGTINYMFWGIGWATSIVIFFIGLLLFNKTERTFMDTI